MSDVLSLDLVVGTDSGSIDLLLLHGLTGDSKKTWTCEPNGDDTESKFWPDWLCQQLPEIRCFTLGYPAGLIEQWARKEMGLFERSKSVLDLMESKGFGQRPIVFICHSLGGLLAKQMIKTADGCGNPAWQMIVDKTAAIIFLATPHSGSSLANSLQFLMPRLASKHIEILRNDNDALTELNESFRQFVSSSQIKIAVYYEKFKTKSAVLVVDRQSADPGIPKVIPVPVDADHSNICKPTSHDSPVYLGILKHLRHVVATSRSINGSPDAKSESDRRDLLEKLIDANMEHEYSKANELQIFFAREYYRLGLHTPAKQEMDGFLRDIEQRFLMHVYQAKICTNASDEEIRDAIQKKVIDPVVDRHGPSKTVNPLTVLQAIYYLTEQCHIRWDPA